MDGRINIKKYQIKINIPQNGIINQIINPEKSTEDIILYRQLRLLSSLLIITLILGIFLIIFTILYQNFIFGEQLSFFPFLFGEVFIFILFLLNRKGHYKIAAVSLLTFFSIFLQLNIIMNLITLNETGINTSTISIIYLILPIFLSMILLNKIFTYVYSIMNILLVIIITILLQNPIINYIVVKPIIIMILASTLLLFVAQHLSKLEEDRKKTILESKEEIKKAHDKLKNVNKILEKKVDERTHKIQVLLKQKDEFINRLSHDLKTPLGPMFYLLPLLEKNENDPKKKEMIQVLKRNSGFMKNLVTKTIELAQLNSPNTEFKYEKINITDEINTVLKNNKTLLDEKNIKTLYNNEKDYFIYADKIRVEELLNNVLNNAIKYSTDNSKIEINIQDQPEHIHVSIKDKGMGMSSEQLSHVFDEFYKADESRHDFDSSGLGLSICKKIVDKHSGKIWIESPGLKLGSTIHFKLPKQKYD